jgi:hypothetical protein
MKPPFCSRSLIKSSLGDGHDLVTSYTETPFLVGVATGLGLGPFIRRQHGSGPTVPSTILATTLKALMAVVRIEGGDAALIVSLRHLGLAPP